MKFYRKPSFQTVSLEEIYRLYTSADIADIEVDSYAGLHKPKLAEDEAHAKAILPEPRSVKKANSYQ